MTGRGIDQILPHAGDPALFESYLRSARQYVELAEKASGPIARPVDFAYVWGDAVAELRRLQPEARIVNLETAVTVSANPWPGKAVHYRMHPRNLPCLAALPVDCCVLSNNHVLDWGREGLVETLDTLQSAGIRHAGAGRSEAEAARPASIPTTQGRVLVFAYGMRGSGIPGTWRATARRAGIALLDDLSAASIEHVARAIAAHKRSGDLAIVSLHWGPNWGFGIEQEERRFAHALLDVAGADLVHGHSSHHVKGIEVHQGKLILYGCGDLLTDYEGISGYEAWRGELGLMYFPTLDASGRLQELVMTPTCVRHLRVNRADAEQTAWLAATLTREGGSLGTAAAREPDGTLRLRWG